MAGFKAVRIRSYCVVSFPKACLSVPSGLSDKGISGECLAMKKELV